MNKEIEKAKEDLQFFNEGDYITKEMEQSADVLEEYIKQLEFNIEASKKEHKYDLAMIDEVKGVAVKLYRILNKTTDKIKEKIEIVETTIELCETDEKIAKYKIKQLKEEQEDLQEILNIIEGEKK